MKIPLGLIEICRLIRTGLVCALLFLGCAAGNDYPENIILFIGDGMGVAHITAGKIARGNINLERFSVVGLVTTHSANQLITESAAAATALATGYKTNNRAISVSVNREPLKTLFEYAKEQGKSVGVVVTSSVTHATPAAFMAHADDRSQQADIAEQIAYSTMDVLIGGGWSYFVPAATPGDVHTLALVRATTKNPAASGYYVYLDALEVLASSETREQSLEALSAMALQMATVGAIIQPTT